MDKTHRHQIIIVGAGIAGLTAAWHLKKCGVDALVLEAEKTVGGRMQSYHVDDISIDYGTQFLSSAYQVIPELIKDVGLNDQFIKSSQWVGFVNQKGIEVVHLEKPFQWIKNKVFSIFDIFRLGYVYLKLIFSRKKISVSNDIGSWANVDSQNAKTWADKHIGKKLCQKLIAPVLNGLYFQSLDQTSAVLAEAVLSFSAYRPRTMSLTSGLHSLPEKLLQRLNVKTGIKVNSIVETPTEIHLNTTSGEFTAKQVILAVPSHHAKQIVKAPDQQMKLLFETRYCSNIIISLLVNDKWNFPEKLSHVYGLVFDPEINSHIATITLENNKNPSIKFGLKIINVMLSDNFSKRNLTLTDNEIYQSIQTEIQNIFPDIQNHIEKKLIHRWENAMPYSPIGRAKAVKEYRETRKTNNKTWLAGDYLGFPWIDSASETGLWAAKKVIKALQSLFHMPD